MSRLHIEKVLQNELVQELTERGWDEGVGYKSASKYDTKRALYTEDVLTWLKTTEPGEYAKIKAMHNGEADEKLIKRLIDVLEQQGTISILRRGFDYLNAHFPMCAFPPNSDLNPSEAVRYRQNILRVAPELEYSEHNERRLDVGFFLNGIPVATAEMKTDNTQTIDDALRQYCEDRPPKDEKTKKDEPLLKWKRGAIVHFAISSSEVQMTTRLDGPKTVFLPFNRGNDGGAGNRPGSGINYMWEEVLTRDAWLNILGNFVCIETRKKAESGKIVRKETLLFPRYHQWDAVTKLVAAAREEGPGQRYLVQHSAGSGKSNTIMWLAHRLANLHNDADKKVFDSTFIVTDRTNLDDQLAETVKQFDNKAGLITRIGDESASKAQQLKDALDKGTPIIIVTLQTFPFVLDTLQGNEDWQKRNFAIIADEAHSSQAGATAQKVREMLGLTPEDGDITADDALAASMAQKANPKNISYFAFTATPKKRTIEIFGRKGLDGKPASFHVYTMRQAIEEGFILDVLEDYMTFETAFRLATSDGSAVVPKSDAAKVIRRYLDLHSYTIQQKIAVIVAHFRETVAKELSGHAKAMIVTASREAAIRYKIQIDKYLASEGFTDVKTLVAFSGEVSLSEDFPGTYRESAMNGIKEEIPEAFDTNEYQVLIVAEKYQTGFDQPKLCAMYVDKKLEGLAAVQTLSRLNRTYNGPLGKKETAYVLDFINDRERIKEAFLPYYETAEIDTPTDPNAVYDLARKIDDFGIPRLYSEADIETFAQELFKQSKSDKQKQTTLNNLIAPVANRYMVRAKEARDDGDTQFEDEAKIFRKDLSTYVRLYRFLSQIYNFENLDIAKREAFYEWLARNIREKQTGERPDISSVQLTHFTIKETFRGQIRLDGNKMLEGGDGVGRKIARVKQYGPLQDVVDLMNEFFGGNTTEDNRITMIAGVFDRAISNETIQAQAKNNTLDKFMLGNINSMLKRFLTETYVEEADNNTENTRQLGEMRSVLSEEEKLKMFTDSMGRAVFDYLRESGGGPASRQ
jgi:type I restriction enzyme R subunit